jgi:integrase
VRLGDIAVHTVSPQRVRYESTSHVRGLMKFTQRSVEAAACPSGKKDALVFDSDLPGFGLRVSAAGGKVFLAQYRIGKVVRRIPLGGFGVLTVEEARKLAKAILGAVAAGADPAAERRSKAAADAVARLADQFTFEKLIEDWAKARATDRRPSYLREAISCLRRNLPDWQKRPASGISATEAIFVLDALRDAKGTVAANRTLAYARAAFGWAVARHKLTANPLRGLERAGVETPRDRVLNAGEIGAIWRASEELTSTLGAYVRVLLLTLQRRQEVAAMQWNELDSLSNPSRWTLPAARAKNKRAHIIHLPDPVKEIIRSLPRVPGNPYVFAGQGAKPISAFNYVKARLEIILKDAGSPVANWRFHDFRRAGVTALAEMKFPHHVCDRILNHVTGEITGVAAVYQRYDFLEERQAALDAWARFVLSAATGAPVAENVVPLRKTPAAVAQGY